MKYRAEIDGLRAVAVVPVILFHAGIGSFGGGFVGVDVFFVISGYLITSIILTELDEGKFSLVKFYERRARRILPALFFVMAVCLPFAWLWLIPRDMEDFTDSIAATVFFASNFLFKNQSGYFATANELKPLIHTWSLAVEEQYYIIFPLLLMAIWRFGKKWVVSILIAVFLISLVLAHLGAYSRPTDTFYLLHTRAWELFLGAFAALYLSWAAKPVMGHSVNQAMSILGVSLIAVSVFWFDSTTPSPSLFTLAPTLGAALIILFSQGSTLTNRILGCKPVVAIGLISYSAYLWHQPLLAFARHRSLYEPSTAWMLFLCLVTFPMAFLTWRFIERPFRQKNRINRRAVFVSASVFAVMFAAIGASGRMTEGYEGRFDGELFKMASHIVEDGHGQQPCWNSIIRNPSLKSACRIGQEKTPASFAIFGDSQAGSMVGALSDEAKLASVSGLNFTLNSCPPVLQSKSVYRRPVQEACDAFREDFWNSLDGDSVPQNIILSNRWTLLVERERFNNQEGGVERGGPANFVNELTPQIGYENAILKDYQNSVNRLLESGRRVFLVYPIPEMGWDVPYLLMKIWRVKGHLDGQDGSTSYDVFLNRNRRTIAALDEIGEHPNLVRIYPHRLLCNSFVQARCVAHANDEVLYYDDDHLSIYGAKLIGRKIIVQIANPD